MKILFTILITFSTVFGFSQDTSLTKKNLNSIFSKNAKGTLFTPPKKYLENKDDDVHHSNYVVWQIENNDSSYFKADTIVLHNYEYAYFNLEIGKIIEWTFYKKNKVYIAAFDSRTAVSTVGFCCNKLKIEQKKDDISLIIYKDKEIISHFKAIKLSVKRTDNQDTYPYYALTLKRVK